MLQGFIAIIVCILQQEKWMQIQVKCWSSGSWDILWVFWEIISSFVRPSSMWSVNMDQGI